MLLLLPQSLAALGQCQTHTGAALDSDESEDERHESGRAVPLPRTLTDRRVLSTPSAMCFLDGARELLVADGALKEVQVFYPLADLDLGPSARSAAE